MWGRITVRKAEGGNSGKSPFWRLISSMHPRRGRSLALMIHEGLMFIFFAERGKKECLESPVVLFWVVLGFECPNPLPCLSAVLQWYIHSAIASPSSPVGTIHGRGWRTDGAQSKYYSLLFCWGWTTPLYMWIWLDIFSPGKYRLPLFSICLVTFPPNYSRYTRYT